MLGDADHPLWSLIRVLVLTGAMYLFASHFDETELKAVLLYAFFGEGGAAGMVAAVRRAKK